MNIHITSSASYRLHESAGYGFMNNANHGESLKYTLAAMQASDIIETIGEKGMEELILSLLYPKGTVRGNIAKSIFNNIGRIPDIEISPDIAKAMMNAKDKAGTVHGARGAIGDISHKNNYASILNNLFPNIGNVSILSLPGPSSTMMLSKIQELGIGVNNTTIASTNGKLGGIWTDENLPGVSGGTKINPGDFAIDNNLILPAAYDLKTGSGKNIQEFVTQLGKRINVKEMLQSEVTKIEKNNHSGYLVTFNNQGREYQREYNIVLFGPGAHINIPFPNNRIQQVDENNNQLELKGTDKDIVQTFLGCNISIKTHRWQEDPSSIDSIIKKLGENVNSKLLFHGFGNSTIGAILYCIENNINFRVISDNPIEYFQYPDKLHHINGKVKMLARNLDRRDFNPQTGISYDYQKVKDLIKFLLQNNLIETDINKVQWLNKDGKYSAKIYKKSKEIPKIIKTINENYCLYGYKPDTNPIRELVETDNRGITATDWTHQAIDKETGKSHPGLFVHGLAAHGANNAVLPGIGYDTPATMVAALIHTIRLYKQGKIKKTSVKDKLQLVSTQVKRTLLNNY